jgi:hypothetical protein
MANFSSRENCARQLGPQHCRSDAAASARQARVAPPHPDSRQRQIANEDLVQLPAVKAKSNHPIVMARTKQPLEARVLQGGG